MPRFVNAAGVVIDVTEETALSLGSGWKPAEVKVDPKKLPIKPTTKK